MAKKNEKKLGYTTIKDLEKRVVYPVKYSTFSKRTGSRGNFMSASFIIQIGETEDDVVWISTPTENSAFKAIGIMTSQVLSTGERLGITALEVVENNKYLDFRFTVEPYTTDTE